VQRVDLLLDNLGHGGDLTPAKVVSAMNKAATQDVREITVEPALSKLLHGGRAPSKRDAELLTLLDQWHRQGASVLGNANGQVIAPGAAIMDTAWPLLADSWASPVLGRKLTAELASFDPQFDGPLSGQQVNGQEKSWIAYLNKDLRTILGERVRGKYAVRYCGGGSLKRCRKLMWQAIDQAGRQLAARQGPNPSDWHSSATAERISFVPGVLTIPGTSQLYAMRYTNRPSGIQQVLSFYGHAPQDTGR
jgi:hypothetical protein